MPKEYKKIQREQAATRAEEQEKLDQENAVHVLKDEKDAKKLEEILDALEQCDTAKMLDIIKHHPYNIASLIQPKNNAWAAAHGFEEQLTSGLTCPYALHAVLVPLVSEDCDSVLNEMTDYDIGVLKSSIDFALQLSRPSTFVIDEIAKLEKELETHRGIKIVHDGLGGSTETTYPLKEDEFIIKQRELKAKKVEKQFVEKKKDDNKENKNEKKHDLWEDACEQLQRWAGAIKVFIRTKPLQVISAEPKKLKRSLKLKQKMPMDMLLTIPQLADILKTTPSKIYAHVSRCLNSKNQTVIDKINTWFVFKIKNGKRQVHAIRESCVKPYSELFAKIRPYNRKEKSNPAKTAPVVAKKPANATTKTLSDLQALAAYADGLVEICNKAKTELDNANKKFADAGARVVKETDAKKRTGLIEKMDKANDAVLAAEKAYNEAFGNLSEAKSLLQAHLDAESALNVVNARIAKFLEKQNQK